MEIHLGKPRGSNPDHLFNVMIQHGQMMLRGLKVYKKKEKYLFVYPNYKAGDGTSIPFFKLSKHTEQAIIKYYEDIYLNAPLPAAYPRPLGGEFSYDLSIFSEQASHVTCPF